MTVMYFEKISFVKTNLFLTAFLGVTLVLIAPRAQAIVSYNSASLTSGVGVSALNGVANITITDSQGYETCSGTLVDGGAYVLTAAHCFTLGGSTPSPASAVSMAFESGTVTASASAVYVDPSWKGVAGDAGDLALIKLSSPITKIASTPLDYNSALGSEVMIAGVGLNGTGATGENFNTNENGNLYYGYNQYISSVNGIYTFNFTQANMGLGTLQATTADGDSGGPGLVQVNGVWALAGVDSYGITPNGLNVASFGTSTGQTSVAANAAWLQSYLVSTVPEPSHGALLLSGLCVVVASSRRRVRRRDL